jgi:hypothetical protein
MANIQYSPGRVKKEILEFLKNRGGICRSGANSVQQVLYWKIFRSGGGSHHWEITALQENLKELEAMGEVVTRRNHGGTCNYIALKSADDPESTTGGELSNTDFEELFATMSIEYGRMQRKLIDAEVASEENLNLAAQYDVEARQAREMQATLGRELEAVKAQLETTQNVTDFDGVRKILTAQEDELSKARADVRLLTLDKEENLTTNKRLSDELSRVRGENESLRTAEKIAQSKVRDLTGEVKLLRKESESEIGRLKAEIARMERGDGLTAAKAAAAAVLAVDGCMDKIVDEILDGVTDSILDNCVKYLPPDKHESFKREVTGFYDKMLRRRSG